MAKKIKFADRKNRVSGVTGEHLAIIDEKWDVKMTVKATNATNLAPEINDKIVRRMNVISVWTKWNNIQELVRSFKRIND
jgi:hypothetical protein